MWPWRKKKQAQKARISPYWEITTRATGGPGSPWSWVALKFEQDEFGDCRWTNRLDSETSTTGDRPTEEEATAAAKLAIRDEEYRLASRRVHFVTPIEDPEG